MVPGHGYSLHEDQIIQNGQQHPATSIYSTSTPELNRINLTYHHQHQIPQAATMYQMPTQDQIFAELQRLNLYKPPPPYPGTNPNGQHQHIGGQQNGMISSTSTPDLASTNIMSAMNATHSALLGGSSPDLVSRKNLGRVANAQKDTTLHKTMENLHNFMEQQMQYEEADAKSDPVGGFSKQVSSDFQRCYRM